MSMSQEIHFEGLSLTVKNIEHSIEFYEGKLGLKLEHNASPDFALLRIGGHDGGTIGLLSQNESEKEGIEPSTSSQKRAVHIEFSTDNLDILFEELKAKGVIFQVPPHDEPWERSMTAFDPDGYSVEFAQGKRGHNALKV
jgi:catechol 2,3-dioxygenase-like lactoylglutathione lyase family enzyme